MDGTDDTLAAREVYAKQLASAGRWDKEAVAANARILGLHPGSLVARNRLAKCHFCLGNLDEAEALCYDALRLDPHSLAAQMRLDAISIRRKHEQLASRVATFEDAFQQGLKARRRGNSNFATVLLERACCLREDAACRIALAACYRATRRLAEAEDLYLSVLKGGFNKAAAVGLAAVRRDQGKLDTAAALNETVLSRIPDDEYASNGFRAVVTDKHKPPWERRAFLNRVTDLGSSSEDSDVRRETTRSVPVQAFFVGICEPQSPGGYACGGWHVAPHPRVRSLEAGLSGHAFYRHDERATEVDAGYRAAIDALRAVYRTGYRGPVTLRGDSRLVVNQFNGAWKCHTPELQELLRRLRYAATFFEKLYVFRVPREQVAHATGEARNAYHEASGASGSISRT